MYKLTGLAYEQNEHLKTVQHLRIKIIHHLFTTNPHQAQMKLIIGGEWEPLCLSVEYTSFEKIEGFDDMRAKSMYEHGMKKVAEILTESLLSNFRIASSYEDVRESMDVFINEEIIEVPKYE